MPTGKKVVLSAWGLLCAHEAALTRFDTREKMDLWTDTDYDHCVEVTRLTADLDARTTAKTALAALMAKAGEPGFDMMSSELLDGIEALDVGETPLHLGATTIVWLLGRVQRQQHMPQFAGARQKLVRALSHPVDVELVERK